MNRYALLLIAGALLCSCGDDGAGSSCVETGSKICSKAVQCNGSAALIAVSGGTATVEHDSESACRSYYSMLSCTDEQRASADYSACNLALDTAQCTDTSKGKALELPTACTGLAM